MSRVLNSLNAVSYCRGHDDNKFISRPHLIFCSDDLLIQACIWVLEEVQNRTADGWKLIPLDAVKAHIDCLPENSDKTRLVESVARLVQYREKLRRRLATEKQSDDMFKVKYKNSTTSTNSGMSLLL